MILMSRKYLLNFSIIISLVMTTLFVGNVSAQNPRDNYAELKNLQHLNNGDNRRFVDELIRQVNAEPYLKFQAPIYAYIAKLKTNDGNWPEGKQYLNKAIAALENVENDNLVIDSLENISWIFFIRGDYSQAIFYVQKMADYAYENGNERGQIVALNRLALSYVELALFELALEPLEMALALARKTKNYDSEFLAMLYLINTRINLANVNPQETLSLTLTAERISSKFNTDDGYLSRLKAIVNQQIGDFNAAEHWFKLAEKKAKSNHDVRLMQMVSQNMSEFYLATHQVSLSLDYALRSLEYNKQLAHSNTRATLHYLLSEIYHQLNDEQNSLKYLRAYAEFQQSASNENTVSLVTIMDKRIGSIKRLQKLAELKNSLLSNKVTAQENKNKQQFYIFFIIALMLIFCALIMVFFVHHRMLKAQLLLSMKDELTGAFCRNYLKTYLPAVQSRFEREPKQELSLGALIIDCDDFKFINDTFGHAGGDKALKAIVERIATQIREHDLLLRWGGDEFVVVCESITQAQVCELAKRITRSISDMLIEYEDATLSVTISVGYALHDRTVKFDFDGLIKAADNFLLATKKSGKNNYLGDKSERFAGNHFSNNFSKGNV